MASVKIAARERWANGCNIPGPDCVVIGSMKIAKWVGITMAAALVVGGVMVVRSRAAEARQLQAGLGLGDGGGRPVLGGRIARQLDLTAEQRAEIKAVLAADKDQLTGLLSGVHDARVGLRETIRKPGASEADVRAAAAKVAGVEADLAVERARLYGKISPILTAEQLAKVGELQQRADDLVDGAIAVFGKRLAQ